MLKYKLSVAVFSASLLTACASPNYYANHDYDDERRVVCRKEMPTGSHRKVMTCRQVGGITSEEKEKIFRSMRNLDPFGLKPTRGGGGVAAEGSCGGNRDN